MSGEVDFRTTLPEVPQLMKLWPNRKQFKNFEWWGPTPEESRRIRLSKPKHLYDKRTSVKEAVSKFIVSLSKRSKRGVNIGIGGFVNTRLPIAVAHEIIRQGGVKDITLSYQSCGYIQDVLIGAMLVDENSIRIKRIEQAWAGHELLGLAPCFRYAIEKGLVEIDDYSNYGMSARFKAAAMGVPFIPVRDHGGSSMQYVNRGTPIKCPFTGETVYLLPACHPDVGILHVQMADVYGNCRIFGQLCTCPEIALAANYNIVTCEMVIPNESAREYPNLTEIPWFAVDALVEQPWGAHPVSCWGFYWYDVEHLRMWISAGKKFRETGKIDPLEEYFNKYIFECESFDDFMNKIPYKRLRKLVELDGHQLIIT
ncbi:MAG: CoA transferase subunit A [Candidatus Freyarchaeota archaeon]